nr:glutathione S-transferase T3-like [Lolium perenne]
MLNSATIDIDTTPLGGDEYDEAAMDYEMRPESDEEEAAEGCEEEAAEEITQEEDADVLINPAPAPKKVSICTANYSEVEDTSLIRAWESVSIDAVTGTDQTGKRYWHKIEDAFFQNMPPNALTASRTYRSLQGRWDAIENTVSRWSDCLEQVRNAPPSGTDVDDWDAIAMERYKQMPASKGKAFSLHHCWKLLEHSEKWKLRDKEAPPARGDLERLDDDEDDVIATKRNSGRPDGNKRAKDKLRKEAEAAGLRDKIEEMLRSKELLVNNSLAEKRAIAEMKSQEKQAKWDILRQDEMRKTSVEEKRAMAEENRAMAELIAQENKVMMMDPSTMDAFTKEWWDLSRMEILARRRAAAVARAAWEEAASTAAAATANGGDGGVNNLLSA